VGLSLKIAILIPSYKRPQVLKETLYNVLQNSMPESHLGTEVGLYVALNESSPEDMSVITSMVEPALQCNVKYAWVSYSENRGKAVALNDLFNKFAGGYDYIVTMDNDMVVKLPWLHLIDVATRTDFELMGFGSSTFWAHQPRRELLGDKFYTLMDMYHIYRLDQIAGGMMLFPRQTLEKHKWTNKGGVYGFDDAQMCLDVNKKFVMFWDQDWLDHDPLGTSASDLKQYHDRKQHFFNNGQYILQKGWDS